MSRRFYAIGFVILMISGFFVYRLNTGLFNIREESRIDLEMVYFPSGNFMKETVMGYEAVAADFAWLKAIQYYGKHRLGDRLFIYLDHIFDIVTDLDPNFINAYKFGALVIAQDARNPDAAQKLLSKGIYHNPDMWELYFDKGFFYYILQKDYRMASHYFSLASEISDASPRCKQWAAFVAQKGSEFEKSRIMWQSILNNATDDFTKQVAETALDNLQIDNMITVLGEMVQAYQNQYKHLPTRINDLIQAGLISGDPSDPLGGFYVIHSETGEVFSSIRLNEKIDAMCSGLTHNANKFRNEHGRYAASVAEMQAQGFVSQTLELPYGTSYIFNAENGQASPIYVAK